MNRVDRLAVTCYIAGKDALLWHCTQTTYHKMNAYEQNDWNPVVRYAQKPVIASSVQLTTRG